MTDSRQADEGTRLEFERADYGEGTEAAPALRCTSCQREIADEYYEANGRPVCGRCRFDLEHALEAGSPLGRVLRAVAGGLLAAVIGAGIYYVVLALTGYQIGLVAIVVGFLVGAGVRWGSHARGGWLYQTIAVGLTYVAIVSTYIPLILGAPASQPSQAASSPTSGRSGRAAAGNIGTGTTPVESPAQFTERITAELRTVNAPAAEAFAEGNSARDSGDMVRAERLYRHVLQLQPRFDHAMRRLCGVLSSTDRRDEAIPLCRQALQQNASVFNRVALVAALTRAAGGAQAPSADLAEAVSEANALLDRTDLDETNVSLLCESALHARDLQLLRRCSARLDDVAPLSLGSAYFGWVLAMAIGDFGQAEVRLEKAHEAGLDEKAYQQARADLAQARRGPGWPRRLANAARLLTFAMALPFLLGFRNIMGIAIIGFALYQAWRMNRRVPLQVSGPYRVGAVGPDLTRGGGADVL